MTASGFRVPAGSPRNKKFQGGVISLLIILMALVASPASAHATLVSSDPPAGAVLTNSPQQVILQFSEDLDPTFSRVELWNTNGDVVVPGPGEIPPGQTRTLILTTGMLPNGTYSAVWRARSLIDGHVTAGNVGFSVGEGSPQASRLPPVGTPPSATVPPPIADAVTRWLSYLFAALIGGSLLFALLIWQPIYTPIDTIGEADVNVGRLLRWLGSIGLVGLSAATLAFLVVQASNASGGNLAQALSSPLIDFLRTRTGILLGIRLALILGLGILVFYLPSLGRGPSVLWWIASLFLGAVLLTFSLQSHGASLGSVLAIILGWVHLAAMCAWLGSLVPLVLLITSSRDYERLPDFPDLRVLIHRFSAVALISVGTLIVTGLYSAWLHVKTLEALELTSYGRILIIKAIIVVLLTLLGAINLLVLSPKLPEAVQWLRHTTRTELILGALVLAAAGALTSVSPAYDALAAQRREGFVETVDTDGVHLIFRIAPLEVGFDEFAVDVTDTRLGASSRPGIVLLRFQAQQNSLGETQAETVTEDNIRYTLRGSYLTVQGVWRITVIVRRPGFDDVRYVFTVSVGAPAASGQSANTGPQNPIQPDAASVSRGQPLYQSWCVPCHGVAGKGDGPIGITLNPPPADLTAHTAPGVHTDRQLYLWITNGYPNSQMPAFKGQLDDQQRWDIVNYIRTLAQP